MNRLVARLVQALAIVLGGCGPSQEGPTQPGFLDFVENPDLLESFDEAQREEQRRIDEAKSWDDARIAKEVRAFILQNRADGRVLASLGPRVHGSVLGILRDDSLRGRLVEEEDRGTPLERACDLLGDAPPAEAVGPVARFADDPSPEIRGEAALLLGKAATAEAAPPLAKLLADEDEDVADYALMGLQFAIRDGRLEGEVGASLFDAVRKLVEAGSCPSRSAAVLLGLDRERGAAVLLSDAVWESPKAALGESLNALADAKLPAPRDRLLALIAEQRGRKVEDRDGRAIVAACRLLGRSRTTEDRAFLEAQAAGPDSDLAAAAWPGLIAWHGLEGYEERLWDLAPEARNPSQKVYDAVFMLNAEVANGGFSQYFFNSSGDDWKQAVAGLKAVGSTEYAKLMGEALARFGETPPPADREARMDRLADLTKADDDLFGPIDGRWYAADENLDVLLDRFVVAHAEDFR